MTWTRFMDMHSGGGQKEKFAYCYIEAPEDEARSVFYARFGHDASRVTCTCCGPDYSVDEYPTLEKATAYDRKCNYVEDERGWLYGDNRPDDYKEGFYLEPRQRVPKGMKISSISLINRKYNMKPKTLQRYLKDEGVNVMVIRSSEIKAKERQTKVRRSGYVWED